MPIPTCIRLLFATALTVAAAAQQPTPAKGSVGGATAGSGPSGADATTGGEQRLAGSYDEAQSRDLFRACDGDSDDRLDIFEAAQALETIRDARDSAGFATLDHDRDGFVSWPEFDQHLRLVLRRDGVFRAKVCRRLAPGPGPRTATPLQQFLQLHDKDQNGGLDPAEIDAYLRQSNLPPQLGGLLKTLDVDQSGRIEEAELAPWFERLANPGPLPLPLFGPPPAASSALMPPWGAADLDRDGNLDAAELERVLRRLDAGLARWAAQLLRRLDKDKNGKLAPSELPGPGNEGDTATANAAPALPVKAPLR
ncbi:MAG: hypothetical protein JNN13_16920 [Planctomycetes bacterium]|nr:hypothetical protein [Planctomycetota bacterium]